MLGEVAFSEKFGFLERGYDLEHAIKTIDDMQWYDGLVGQVPEMDFVFRRNPIRQYIPFLSTKKLLITSMALKKMDERTSPKSAQRDRKDLLDHLFQGHRDRPDKFSEGDVFAVAHGAMYVSDYYRRWWLANAL